MLMFFISALRYVQLGMFALSHSQKPSLTLSSVLQHDVGWGTKGDNGAAKDLGSAKKVKGDDGKEMMEVKLPTAREDVDGLWAASRDSLRQKPPPQNDKRDAATKQSDHDRNTRTNVVLLWVGTNMAMILAFTSTSFVDVSTSSASFVVLAPSDNNQQWVADVSGHSAKGPFNPYLIFLFYSL